MSGLQAASAVLAKLDLIVGELLPDSKAQGIVRELALEKLAASSDEADVRRVVDEVMASDTVKPLLDGVPTLRFGRARL